MQVGQKVRALAALGGHYDRIPLNSEQFDGYVHVGTIGVITAPHPIVDDWAIASFPRGLDKGVLAVVVSPGLLIDGHLEEVVE